MIDRPRKLPGKYIRKQEYEFDYYTKHTALISHGCRCAATGEYGSKNDPIEIHHGLPIYIWYKYFRHTIPVSVLTSIHNAIPLKASIHEELHRQADLTHYTQMATLLMVMAREDKQQLAMF